MLNVHTLRGISQMQELSMTGGAVFCYMYNLSLIFCKRFADLIMLIMGYCALDQR